MTTVEDAVHGGNAVVLRCPRCWHGPLQADRLCTTCHRCWRAEFGYLVEVNSYALPRLRRPESRPAPLTVAGADRGPQRGPGPAGPARPADGRPGPDEGPRGGVAADVTGGTGPV